MWKHRKKIKQERANPIVFCDPKVDYYDVQLFTEEKREESNSFCRLYVCSLSISDHNCRFLQGPYEINKNQSNAINQLQYLIMHVNFDITNPPVGRNELFKVFADNNIINIRIPKRSIPEMRT